MIRNHANSKGVIFQSKILNFIEGSHPTLLDRLNAIKTNKHMTEKEEISVQLKEQKIEENGTTKETQNVENDKE